MGLSSTERDGVEFQRAGWMLRNEVKCSAHIVSHVSIASSWLLLRSQQVPYAFSILLIDSFDVDLKKAPMIK
ncbi:hypothetical protein YC2023_067229 [Brassica napus]